MKKIIFLFIVICTGVFAQSKDEKEIKNIFEKYAAYQTLVADNNEREYRKTIPTMEEIQYNYNQEKLQLERDKIEFEKNIEYEKLQEEKRRNRIIDSALIGGAGYGIYRIGRRHHHW